MRTIVKGKNVEVPDRVRAYAERKLGHIARLVDDRTDAIVELSNEHHRSAVRCPHRRGRRSSSTAGRCSATRPGRATRPPSTPSSTRSSDRPSTTRNAPPPGPADRGEGPPAADRRRDVGVRPANAAIVKIKRFAIEPMFEEDAIAAMEELGHTFFVFVNAENERVAVLYARDDGELRPHRADRRRRLHPRRGERPPLTSSPRRPWRSPLGRVRAAGHAGRRYSPAARVIRPSSTR